MPEIKQRFQMPNSLKSPKMSIIEDIQTVFAKDPAARSTLEVIPVLSGPACPRDILDPEAGIDIVELGRFTRQRETAPKE